MIIIDSGHIVGKDPGAIGPGGIYEAVINWTVTKLVANFMFFNNVDCQLTHKGQGRGGFSADREVDLRAAFVVQQRPAACISIHCNSSTNREARGTETFCYKFGGNSERLANSIQSEVVKALGTIDRGVKEGNLAMVREPWRADIAACLVELGFISNPGEEALLISHTAEAARAIAIGIFKFLGVEYTMPDENQVAEWAREAAAWCVKNHIIEAADRPTAPLTRQEAWQMFYNAGLAGLFVK